MLTPKEFLDKKVESDKSWSGTGRLTHHGWMNLMQEYYETALKNIESLSRIIERSQAETEKQDYQTALIAELIHICENPEHSNKECKDIISEARSRGYGM